MLNKFLYAAVNGSVDEFVNMSEPTKRVLYDTFKQLLDRVDKDAPSTLEKLKANIGTGERIEGDDESLAAVLGDKTINPLNLPMEFLQQAKFSK